MTDEARATRGDPPATKTCPRCAEEIKAAALVCHYCGHEFSEAATAPSLPAPPPPPAPQPSYPPPAPPGAGYVSPAGPQPMVYAPLTPLPAPAKGRARGCLVGAAVALVVALLAVGVGVYLYQQHENAPMRTHHREGVARLEDTVEPADEAVKAALKLNAKLGTSVTTVEQLEPLRRPLIDDIEKLKEQRAAARAEFQSVLDLDDASDLYRRGARLFIDFIDTCDDSMDKIVAQLEGISPQDLSPAFAEGTRTIGASNALFWQKEEELLAQSTSKLKDLD